MRHCDTAGQVLDIMRAEQTGGKTVRSPPSGRVIVKVEPLGPTAASPASTIAPVSVAVP